MTAIDTIVLSNSPGIDTNTIPYTIVAINHHVAKLIKTSPLGYIAFRWISIESVNLEEIEVGRAQVWTFDVQAFPDFLSYSVPSSFFNLRPNTIEHTSWLVSLKNCIIDKALLTDAFLDERFDSVDGAVLNWSYQQLWKGAIIRRRQLVNSKTQSNFTDRDQLRLVYLHQGFKWALWASLRVALTQPLRGLRLIRGLTKFTPANHSIKPIDWTRWVQSDYDKDARVTILIPTVDRYPYLETLLTQLADQTIKPVEIIIVDQTAVSNREDLNHSQLPLKVFYLNEAGQCRSRNYGLQESIGDYILFLDDDDEVYPELIADHLKTLQFFGADGSCGTCQEPGQGKPPWQYRNIRISDLFSTNNGMLKRSALVKSGLFDMVYDRGQRADGDLGARLYLNGSLIILNPSISVIHHRAPQGGLRKHKVRKVTYATSRTRITHRRLPHVTELYFNLRYFTALQQKEYRVLAALGTLSVRGSILKKIAKLFFGLLIMPNTIWILMQRQRKAAMIFKIPLNLPILKNELPSNKQ
jgi:glycosyltransferase involved in cell wall biosynthesis